MIRQLLLCFMVFYGLDGHGQEGAVFRHWKVADGLPTGEVRQIVELPNGQMLVNCEGVFCLSNGQSFDVVDCDQRRACQLPQYANRYGQLWMGDSLLWLRDLYRVYLFDTRSRSFRYDIEKRLKTNAALQRFADGEGETPKPTEAQWHVIDSLHLRDVTLATTDSQGGLWIGTRTDGIVYVSPPRPKAELLTGSHWMIRMARSTVDRQGRIWHCRADGVACEEKGVLTLYSQANVPLLPHNRTTFITQLSDTRYLLCDSLCLLGYFLPERREYKSLNDRIPVLQHYRRFVGACVVDDRWTAVYTQNGMFLLDTQTDKLAAFPPAEEIERYSSKYNCMLKDRSGNLWIGTQNGLFKTDSSKLEMVNGLANNCIRSLVMDAEGHVWAGTSCGISRITPTVVNLGIDDGIPAAAMMDHAACLTGDGRLVFAMGGTSGVTFRPGELIGDKQPLPVVLTRFYVNGNPSPFTLHPSHSSPHLSYTQNYLTFQFSTLDYASPSHTRYRYRLRGLESEWNTHYDGSGQATASYKALPPGRYVFEVQAAQASDQWGETTLLAFVIEPPLWLTWWAKMTYCLVGLIGLIGLIRLYLRRKKAQMERENEAKVNHLFELREEARKEFVQNVNINAAKIGVNAEEKQLVKRLMEAIEQNMGNADYTVDQLATDIAMSRANLYSKMGNMLGITPSDFIRNVRLKRAALLLAETDLPIADIAYKVGFNTPRVFSSNFKKMFGVLPSEYREP